MKLGVYKSSVFTVNGKYVSTVFESETRQLFYTKDDEHYVYYKDTQEFYKLNIDSFIKLLLNLSSLVARYEPSG